MIEQYVYNLITGDTTLQTLLSAGGGKYHLYPNKVNRGIDFDKGVTFTQIGGNDTFPKATSVLIQFNIFAKKHSDLGNISKALADIFNGDNNRSSGGVDVVYSQRQGGESDIPTSLDDPNFYQRSVTYYFKLR